MTDNVMNEEKPGTIRKNHDNRKRKLFVLISVCAAVLVCAAVFLLIFPNGRNQKIYSFPDKICDAEVGRKWGYIDERGNSHLTCRITKP